MAKKKTATKKVKSAVVAKSAKSPNAIKGKAAPKKKVAPKKLAVAKKSAARKAVKEPEVSLGRPLVTQEEKLYMLFHDDYHARQIFEFLQVATVKELEQFSPQQIVRRVSKPVFDTVDRIRAKLAEMKRSLREDEQFATEFRDQSKTH